MAAVTIYNDFWSPPKIKFFTVSIVSPSICQEVMRPFSLITEEGFPISPCYFLELWIQMGISFLFFIDFHFSSFHYKALSNKHFAFFYFFFLGMVLITASPIEYIQSTSCKILDWMKHELE